MREEGTWEREEEGTYPGAGHRRRGRKESDARRTSLALDSTWQCSSHSFQQLAMYLVHFDSKDSSKCVPSAKCGA